MIEYSKDDIPYELACDAHRGTSFKAEERAEQVQEGYVNEIGAVVERLSGFATDDNKHQIKAALEYYRDGYIKHMTALLHAKSLCMSPAIAGPSNFPFARNEKRNNTADKRRDEFLAWDKKAKEKMLKQFDPAILARAPISSDDPTAVELLQAKIEKLESLQVTMKAANTIVRRKEGGKLAYGFEFEAKQAATLAGKVIELKELGLSQDEATRLFVPDFAGRIGYPSYKLTNNNAAIKQAKKRVAQLEQEQTRPDVEDRQVGDVTISENRDLNRLQLIFPGDPGQAMKDKLHANGFHWARSQGAWQRKLNDNARYAVKRVLENGC